MVEAAVATKSPAAPGKAKASSKKPPTASKKPATKPTHPPTSEMVNAAVGALKDRKGVSLQAIKKFIAGNYIVDVERLAPFIKKYIKQAVEKNVLVQTSGVGAAGRFKLANTQAQKKSATKPTPEEAKKTTTKPSTSEEKAKKTTIKSAAASKKSDKPKSPSKAKKSGKAPAAKTKSPKPKSVRN